MELRTYEGMFMLEPTKANQEWDNIKKQIVGMVERREGIILNARKWGERKLAYEIKGHKRAAYLLMYFQIPSENIATLRRDLLLSEIVMRTLIIAQTKPNQAEKKNQEKEELRTEAEAKESDDKAEVKEVDGKAEVKKADDRAEAKVEETESQVDKKEEKETQEKDEE